MLVTTAALQAGHSPGAYKSDRMTSQRTLTSERYSSQGLQFYVEHRCGCVVYSLTTLWSPLSTSDVSSLLSALGKTILVAQERHPRLCIGVARCQTSGTEAGAESHIKRSLGLVARAVLELDGAFLPSTSDLCLGIRFGARSAHRLVTVQSDRMAPASIPTGVYRISA